MANPSAKPPVSRPSAPAPAAAAPSAPPAVKKKFNPLYIVLPLVLGVLVAVGVGWEMFRARMEAAQQGQGGEARLGLTGPNTGSRDRRSREIKTGEEPVVAPPPVQEEDELTGLGKKKKPPPPKVAPTASPSEKAWRGVKNDYDKLEARNESTARRYRMRILTLEDRKATAPEPSFVKEAGALEEELRAELAKPENQ